MTPAELRLRHIVVVGLMGSGKSEVGRRLAERLSWGWRDSDVDIQADTGITVRELRDRDGVNEMHAREARHLLEALALPDPCVISAAASTIDVIACRDVLRARGVYVVWLRARPETLANRFVAPDRHRPAYGVKSQDVV